MGVKGKQFISDMNEGKLSLEAIFYLRTFFVFISFSIRPLMYSDLDELSSLAISSK